MPFGVHVGSLLYRRHISPVLTCRCPPFSACSRLLRRRRPPLLCRKKNCTPSVRHCQHPSGGDVQRQDLQAVAPLCCLQSGGVVRRGEKYPQRADSAPQVRATFCFFAFFSLHYYPEFAGASALPRGASCRTCVRLIVLVAAVSRPQDLFIAGFPLRFRLPLFSSPLACP